MKTTLKFLKSTKGTHVYASQEPNPTISTLYINKTAFSGEPSKTIEVTIDFKEDSE